MSGEKNWKTRYIVIGTLIGAIGGFLAAVMIVKRARDEKPSFSIGQGVQLGMGLLGVVRQASQGKK